MAAVEATILYPNDEDTKFDLEYYLTKHMPMLASNWEPVGLTGWKVTKFTEGPEESKPQFLIGAVLAWESEEKLKAALKGEHAPKVFGDIPNFTNKHPVLLAGGVAAANGSFK